MATLKFNIFVKKEDKLFIAHCLELDIVSVNENSIEVEKEIKSLIQAQVDYTFSNDNFDNLYRPAPEKIWNEFLDRRPSSFDNHRI